MVCLLKRRFGFRIIDTVKAKGRNVAVLEAVPFLGNIIGPIIWVDMVTDLRTSLWPRSSEVGPKSLGQPIGSTKDHPCLSASLILRVQDRPVTRHP